MWQNMKCMIFTALIAVGKGFPVSEKLASFMENFTVRNCGAVLVKPK